MDKLLITNSVLKRAQANYLQMIDDGVQLEIEELLNFGSFKLKGYCEKFSPHSYAGGLAESARGFATDHNIWLENGKQYITCALYLFPDSPLYRIIPIVENCAMDFYLNDIMGREVYGQLSKKEQRDAKQIIQRLTKVDARLRLRANATLVEKANIKILRKISDASPTDWFVKFLELYNQHLKAAHQNCNTEARYHIPNVEEYNVDRCHISGMPHTVAFIEFSSGVFLSWSWLDEYGLSDTMKQLHWQFSLFGCLSNDLFSFEKECIDNCSDSNLVTIVALNHPDWELKRAIEEAARIVSRTLEASIEAISVIKARLAQISISGQDIDQVQAVEKHLQGVERGLQGAWLWQTFTKRYKRVRSIWKETCIL